MSSLSSQVAATILNYCCPIQTNYNDAAAMNSSWAETLNAARKRCCIALHNQCSVKAAALGFICVSQT